MADTTENTPFHDEFALQAVRDLLRMISDTDVTEINIERGSSKLHIKRGPTAGGQPVMITPALAQSPMPTTLYGGPLQAPAAGPAASAEFNMPAGGQTIVSPMVGTFYTGPSPKDPPYVQEGDVIAPGDVVGIVEAMKIMNEVDSEISGRITRILVTNGQPVEYGQALMIVEAN